MVKRDRIEVREEDMHISFADTKLYEMIVVKNEYIKDEYNHYIRVNFEKKGKRNRVLEWIFLFRLHLAYAILNRRKTANENTNAIENNSTKPESKEIDFFHFQRKKPFLLAMELLDYDVISFDIFDTLILRPFKKPDDLFYIIGKRLNFEGFDFGFYKIRTESERMLREEKYRRIGSKEITIYDIYQEIAKCTNIVYEEGVNEEIQAEMDYCFANPYMLQVYKILRSQGKKIIVTSDMYLPKEIMRQLLSKCGYGEFDQIYVSCDYECSKKSNGRNLFDIISRDYSKQRIIHIGDNLVSDVECAQKKGFQASYYKNVHQISDMLRNIRMSEIVKSSYLGMIECKLYNGTNRRSFFYRYGYIYGGLYVLGYMGWVDRLVKYKNIDKLLFVARDGYVYHRVYRQVYDNVESSYFYWSREALMKYCVINRNFEDFFQRVVRSKAVSREKVSIGYFLKIFEIDDVNLRMFNLEENQELNKSVLKNLKQCLFYYWKQICSTYEAGRENFYRYLKAEIGNCHRIGIVDASSNGHGLLNLKYLVEELSEKTVHVEIFMANRQYKENNGFIYDDSVNCYLFSENINSDCYRSMYEGNNSDGVLNLMFEFLTQAPHARFAGIDACGEFNFDPPENENHEAIHEISNGIIDFCNDFVNIFKKDRYIFDTITGSEAFRPFERVAKDTDILRKYFKNIVVENYIVCGTEKGKKETYATLTGGKK